MPDGASLLPLYLGGLSLLVTIVAGGFLVYRGNPRATVAILQGALDAYKEAVLVEERKNKTILEQNETLVKEKDALQSTLDQERQRSHKLEGIIATWTLERQTFVDRIASLESTVYQLQGIIAARQGNPPPPQPTNP